LKLRWYQRKAKRLALEHDGFLLYKKQGTGKTLTALSIVHHRFHHNQVRKLLIVGPLTPLDVWEEHIKKGLKHNLFTDMPYHMTNGRRLKSWTDIPNVSSEALHVITVNYESLRRIAPILKRWRPDFLIADEVHKVKDRNSKQSKALYQISKRIRYKLGTSGTPDDGDAIDYWAQFRAICPEVFGVNWGDFATYYLRKTGYGYIKFKVRKRKEKELIAKIQSRMFRVEEDVLNLNPVIHVRYLFSLSDEGQRVYDQLSLEAVASLGDKSISTPIVLAKITRLSQITGGFIPDDEGELHRVDRQKVRALKRILGRLEPDEKVVVFARFIPEVEAILQVFKQMDRRAVCIMGRVKPLERKRVRKQFLRNPKVVGMVAQVRTGGVGVNEMAVASYGIFYSTTYSWIDFDQAIGRLQRSGQKKQVRFTHLIAKGTIDEIVYSTLREKQSTSNLILNLKRTHRWRRRKTV